MRHGDSCMIYRWQGQTAVVVSEAREVSEARGRTGLPPLSACEWAPPATPVTSRVGKKEKKRALQPSIICYCSHSPGNTPTLQLPLPKPLVGGQTLGHCPKILQLGATGTVPLCGLSGTKCFLCGLQGQGQKTAVIHDFRGGCGPLPLEVPEQNSLAAPFT